jgi:hypothetical protein
VRVSELCVYPLKSAAGRRRVEVEVEPWGLQHDRRWMILDPSGENVTARTESSLLTVQVATEPAGCITLTAPGRAPLIVEQPATGPLVTTGLSRLEHVRLADDVAATWFSELLQRPVRLVWQDDPRRRAVGEKHGGRPGDAVSLADTGPLLLTTTASLRQLDEWVAATAAELGEAVPEPLVMARFRPNVVVDNGLEDGADGVDAAAFVEDSWARLAIGDVEFRAAELCDRCVLTTIEPRTRAKGKEPIRTLARHRRWDGAVWFGLRLIPVSRGILLVGDPVRVLERSHGPAAATR